MGASQASFYLLDLESRLKFYEGIIAARTLHEQGIDDFMIIEARDELGGRMQTHLFGAKENQHIIERGPNWVQGTFYRI